MNAAIASAARIEERRGGARRSRRLGRRGFFGFSALLFAVCTSGTILWCASMSDMGEMPMPGGWTMSMVWMRMPGQTWPGIGATFLGMWTTMMIAMMLPSLVPTLWRQVECRAHLLPGRLAVLIGAGYFSVWIVLGAAVFLFGVVLAAFEMQEPELARAVPFVTGVIVLGAGALQLTGWKAHHLARCRQVPWAQGVGDGARVALESTRGALRCGLRLGMHCSLCSAGPTAILLVVGLMDLRAMAATTAIVTLERLAPAGARIAHAIGAVAIVAGLILAISAA